MEPRKLLQEVARWCRGQAPYSTAVSSVIGPTEDPWGLVEDLRNALSGYASLDVSDGKQEAELLIERADALLRNAGRTPKPEQDFRFSSLLLEGDMLEDERLMFPDVGDE